MSPHPMNDISILLDEVIYPILNNPVNQEGWPEVIKKDVDLHIQELRNVIAEVSFFELSTLVRCIICGKIFTTRQINIKRNTIGSVGSIKSSG